MNIYRRYHTVSLLAVLLGIFTFCVADPHPGLAIVATLGVVGSWFLFRDAVVSPLPRWAINLLLLGATANMFRAAFASRLVLQQDAISILAEYLIFLQLIKLFESRTPRDQAQLLVLNVMLVIGAVLTSVTLQVGLMLAIYAPTFLATVLLFQLFAGQHRAIAPHNRATESVLSMTALATGRRLFRSLRRLNTLGVALIGIVAVLVFVLMPRSVGDDVIGQWPGAVAGASSGFSDTVQLGGQGLISDSRDVVLEFELFINGEKSTLEKNQYLRGTVLDEYDILHGTWNRSQHLRNLDKYSDSQLRTSDGQRGFDRLPDPVSDDTSYVQVITVRNKTTDHLFSLWRPVQVACAAQNPIYLNTEDKTLRMPNREGMLTYTVRSIITPEAARPAADAARRRAAFPLHDRPPPPSPFLGTPIETYARNLMRRAGIERTPDGHADLRIVQLFERHLRDNFTYTLDLVAPPPGVEPLQAFLTQTKAGNCEYFASAMVAMAQAVGIPARIVTGYATNEIDPVTGSYIVRKRHAHAWVEARVHIVTQDPTDASAAPKWIPAWRRFDPTPPSELRALNKPQTGIIGWAQRLIDRAQQIWIRGVVAYNSDRQHAVLKRTGVPSLGLDSIGRFLTDLPRLSLRQAFQFIVSTIVAFVLLVLAFFLIRAALLWTGPHAARAIRRWWLSRTDPAAARHLHQSDLYDRMLRTLARAGLPKPAALPPLAFARTLRPRSPHVAARVERLASLYYAVRFGHAPLTPAALDDAEVQLRALRHDLRAPRSPAP